MRKTVQTIAAKKAMNEEPFVRSGAIKAVTIFDDPASIAINTRIAESDPVPGIRKYAQFCLNNPKTRQK